jgi:hypothetical protein
MDFSELDGETTEARTTAFAAGGGSAIDFIDQVLPGSSLFKTIVTLIVVVAAGLGIFSEVRTFVRTWIKDELDAKTKQRQQDASTRLAVEKRAREDEEKRQGLREQLPRASHAVKVLIELELDAERKRNLTLPQRKQWDALIHKAELEYADIRSKAAMLGVYPSGQTTASQTFAIELLPDSGTGYPMITSSLLSSE